MRGWRAEWVGEKMDGWVDGRVGGRTDGWEMWVEGGGFLNIRVFDTLPGSFV